MNPTKTDDREQWRAKILRALAELTPDEKALDRSFISVDDQTADKAATSTLDV